MKRWWMSSTYYYMHNIWCNPIVHMHMTRYEYADSRITLDALINLAIYFEVIELPMHSFVDCYCLCTIAIVAIASKRNKLTKWRYYWMGTINKNCNWIIDECGVWSKCGVHSHISSIDWYLKTIVIITSKEFFK